MTEAEKDRLTFDEALSYYLADVSKKVNIVYYKTILRFVMLYRECVNEQAWSYRKDHLIKASIPLSSDFCFKTAKELDSKPQLEQIPIYLKMSK